MDEVVVDRSLEDVPRVDDECEIKELLLMVDSTFVDWWIFSELVVDADEVINIEELGCTVIDEWGCTVVDEWKFFVDLWYR